MALDLLALGVGGASVVGWTAEQAAGALIEWGPGGDELAEWMATQ
jgi:hypothetical protein